ncbi:MAG: hypothetical protein ACXVYI_14660 [Mycobacterium sp.]
MIITQLFNTWNKHIDARIKQADRRHERASDYENWARQAKGDALKRLISACRFVKWRPDLWRPENPDENYRRGATIRALDLFRDKIGGEDGISEIEAYAAEPVRKGLDDLLKLIDLQRREHNDQLKELGGIGSQLDADLPQAQRDDLWRQRREALEAIGGRSVLDVDRDVIALCDRVIAAARNDLHVDYTE